MWVDGVVVPDWPVAAVGIAGGCVVVMAGEKMRSVQRAGLGADGIWCGFGFGEEPAGTKGSRVQVFDEK